MGQQRWRWHAVWVFGWAAYGLTWWLVCGPLRGIGSDDTSIGIGMMTVTLCLTWLMGWVALICAQPRYVGASSREWTIQCGSAAAAATILVGVAVVAAMCITVCSLGAVNVFESTRILWLAPSGVVLGWMVLPMSLIRLRRGHSARLAVFCSGQGTNLQAILDAQHGGAMSGEVVVVICDRPEAPAIGRAQRAGVPVAVIESAGGDRQAFESRLRDVLQQHQVELICLAGFMRILSPEFVHEYEWHILNIHPALLPAFPGAHAVADALKHGVKETGVTVHLVDRGVDTGPIVLQQTVKVLAGDDESSLMERLHQVEHRLYPQAIQLWIDGGIEVAGRKINVR